MQIAWHSLSQVVPELFQKDEFLDMYADEVGFHKLIDHHLRATADGQPGEDHSTASSKTKLMAQAYNRCQCCVTADVFSFGQVSGFVPRGYGDTFIFILADWNLECIFGNPDPGEICFPPVP